MKLQGWQHFQCLERKTFPGTEYRDQQHQNYVTEVLFYDDFWFSCARKVSKIIPVAHLLSAMVSSYSFSFSSFMGMFPKNQ